jgi:hypothetical protein
MLEKLDHSAYLYQETVVYEIKAQFGSKFTYGNENGNLAIDRKVLREFRKLAPDTIVWERGDRCWRKRQASDEPGRQQES